MSLSNLLALIGQTAGSLVRSPDQIPASDGGEGDPITVRSLYPDVQEPQTVPPLQGNRQAQLNAYDAVSNPPQHSGAFGIRGLLREVLGTLGDMGRTYQGRDPIYAPQRQRERLSDAMLGFTGGNDSMLSAAERVTAAGDPEAGRALAQAAQEQALRQAQIDATAANNRATSTNRTRDDARALSQIAANVFNAAGNDPARINRGLAILQRMAEANGLTLDQIGITPGMSPEDYALYAAGNWNVNQQQNFPLAQARVNQGQQNADANTTRANRAPAPRAAPNPTEASEIARIRDRLNNRLPLAPGDQQTWDNYNSRLNREAPRTGTRASQVAGQRTISTGPGRSFSLRPSN